MSNVTDYSVQLDNATYTTYPDTGQYLVENSRTFLQRKAASGLLEKLDLDLCIAAYAQDYTTSRGGLILVLDTPENSPNTTEPVLFALTNNFYTQTQACATDPYAWMCYQDGSNNCLSYHDGCTVMCHASPPCKLRIAGIESSSTGWRPLDDPYPVKYCLSEKLPEQCKLQASFYILIMVVILNFIKASMMYITVFGTKKSPILTIGDAIASYVDRPDPNTQGLCLVSKADVRSKLQLSREPRMFVSTPQRWSSAVGKSRWMMFFTM
jgi:hypothetical protein